MTFLHGCLSLVNQISALHTGVNAGPRPPPPAPSTLPRSALRMPSIPRRLPRVAELRPQRQYDSHPALCDGKGLEYVVQRTGAFRAYSRTGIDGTLHRLSAIRNRYRDLVGVTMRVGRHLPGAAWPLPPVAGAGRQPADEGAV